MYTYCRVLCVRTTKCWPTRQIQFSHIVLFPSPINYSCPPPAVHFLSLLSFSLSSLHHHSHLLFFLSSSPVRPVLCRLHTRLNPPFSSLLLFVLLCPLRCLLPSLVLSHFLPFLLVIIIIIFFFSKGPSLSLSLSVCVPKTF